MNIKENTHSASRRRFVKTTSAAMMAAPFIVPSGVLHAKEKPAASDRINLGIIGCGSLGKVNLANCMASPDVELVAACDVWKDRLDPVVEKYKNTCKGYTDFRELLQHKGLDAVIIATPAHWHAIQAIAACEAGVDIYLQKPMTMHFGESKAVRNAVRQHNIICQIGTQIHSSDHYRRMVELIRSGNLGKIGTIRTFHVFNVAPEGIGSGNNTDKVPPGLDWDMWVGPAPMHQFNPNLVKDAYYHGFWYDFSGGWTPGMAPHITDLAIWALKLGLPTETLATGGRFIIRDDGDAYDNHEVLWHYPDLTMTWMSSSTNSYGFDFKRSSERKRRLGMYFHGVNGTLLTDYSEHTILPEGDRMEGMETPPKSIPSSPGQELEWLECVKSRKQPNCNPEYHFLVDAPIQLSTLSLRLGRSIKLDPETEEIIDDKKAAKMAIPEYREPWKFAKKYL